MLQAIGVAQDGFTLTVDEYDNLNIDDGDEANPQLLFGDDQNGFTWTFEFVAPEIEGTYEYTFDVTDVNQLSSVETINITVEGALEVINPEVTLNGPSSFDSPAGSLVQINVAAARGSNDFASVSVWEDGALIEDLSRIRFNGVDFEFNPLPLFSPDSEGFDTGIIIRTIPGDHDYVIQVTDTDDNSSNVMFSIIAVSYTHLTLPTIYSV